MAFWVPDEDARFCAACAEPFTLLRRRHHCRSCGAVFCAGCSASRSLLPPRMNREAPARTCAQCAAALAPIEAAHAEALARAHALLAAAAIPGLHLGGEGQVLQPLFCIGSRNIRDNRLTKCFFVAQWQPQAPAQARMPDAQDVPDLPTEAAGPMQPARPTHAPITAQSLLRASVGGAAAVGSALLRGAAQAAADAVEASSAATAAAIAGAGFSPHSALLWAAPGSAQRGNVLVCVAEQALELPPRAVSEPHGRDEFRQEEEQQQQHQQQEEEEQQEELGRTQYGGSAACAQSTAAGSSVAGGAEAPGAVASAKPAAALREAVERARRACELVSALGALHPCIDPPIHLSVRAHAPSAPARAGAGSAGASDGCPASLLLSDGCPASLLLLSVRAQSAVGSLRDLLRGGRAGPLRSFLDKYGGYAEAPSQSALSFLATPQPQQQLTPQAQPAQPAQVRSALAASRTSAAADTAGLAPAARPLPSALIASLGSQLLSALALLRASGFACTHVHAGNLLVRGRPLPPSPAPAPSPSSAWPRPQRAGGLAGGPAAMASALVAAGPEVRIAVSEIESEAIGLVPPYADMLASPLSPPETALAAAGTAASRGAAHRPSCAALAAATAAMLSPERAAQRREESRSPAGRGLEVAPAGVAAAPAAAPAAALGTREAAGVAFAAPVARRSGSGRSGPDVLARGGHAEASGGLDTHAPADRCADAPSPAAGTAAAPAPPPAAAAAAGTGGPGAAHCGTRATQAHAKQRHGCAGLSECSASRCSAEVVCFGHVLFEMTTGAELTHAELRNVADTLASGGTFPGCQDAWRVLLSIFLPGRAHPAARMLGDCAATRSQPVIGRPTEPAAAVLARPPTLGELQADPFFARARPAWLANHI